MLSGIAGIAPDFESSGAGVSSETAHSKWLSRSVGQSVIDTLINGISGVREVASDARITVVTSPSELPVKILEQAKLEGIPEDEIHGVLCESVAGATLQLYLIGARRREHCNLLTHLPIPLQPLNQPRGAIELYHCWR